MEIRLEAVGINGDRAKLLTGGRELRFGLLYAIHGREGAPGQGVANEAPGGRYSRRENLSGVERLLRAAARQQELGPLPAAELGWFTVRRQRIGLAQQPLGFFHLAQKLKATGQEAEVMRMVPVVLGGDVLRAIVGVLQVIGRAEFLDGLRVEPKDRTRGDVISIRSQSAYDQVTAGDQDV